MSYYWGMHFYWWFFWIFLWIVFFSFMTPIRRVTHRAMQSPMQLLQRRYAAGRSQVRNTRSGGPNCCGTPRREVNLPFRNQEPHMHGANGWRLPPFISCRLHLRCYFKDPSTYYSQKLVGLQAGAPDQRTVHAISAEKCCGVSGHNAAAVLNG